MNSISTRLKRMTIHIPHGIACGYLISSSPIDQLSRIVSMVTYLVVFLCYEHNEDKHINDQAWLDISGWMPGFILWMVGLQIVRMINV